MQYAAHGDHPGTPAQGMRLIGEIKQTEYQTNEPSQIVTGKKNEDGSIELRLDTVARTKPASDGTPGIVDIKKSKSKAKDMINKGTGIRISQGNQQRARRRTNEEIVEQSRYGGCSS